MGHAFAGETRTPLPVVILMQHHRQHLKIRVRIMVIDHQDGNFQIL